MVLTVNIPVPGAGVRFSHVSSFNSDKQWKYYPSFQMRVGNVSKVTQWRSICLVSVSVGA